MIKPKRSFPRLQQFSDYLLRKGSYSAFKRAIDYFLAFVLSFVLLPFLTGTAILLAILFRGNPFYTQRRGLSLEGRIFTIIKFRTMEQEITPVNRVTEIFTKYNAVPRIPAFCYWLRKTGLDELPQIFNVLKGDMCFVGPRPLSIDDLSVIRADSPEEYARRAALRSAPGITGFWQIFGDRNGGVRNLIEMDTMYEKRKSLLFDLYLIVRTLPVMLLADHSDAIFGGANSHADEQIAQNGNTLLKSIFADTSIPLNKVSQ